MVPPNNVQVGLVDFQELLLDTARAAIKAGSPFKDDFITTLIGRYWNCVLPITAEALVNSIDKLLTPKHAKSHQRIWRDLAKRIKQSDTYKQAQEASA